MGRKKEFDPNKAQFKALKLFWKQGYAETSAQSLVDELGINKFSMYSEFGSKKELLYKVIDQYIEDFSKPIYSHLGNENSDLKSLVSLYDRMLERLSKKEFYLGCFICNLSSEEISKDAVIQKKIDYYFEYIRKSILNSLMNSELKSNLDSIEISDYIFSNLIGIAAMRKAKMNKSTIKNSILVGKKYVESLSV